MLRRVSIFAAIAVGLAIAFLAGTRVVPVRGADKPGAGFAAIPGEKGGEDLWGPYEAVEGWPKPLEALPGHEQWTWSTVQGIYAQNPNRIFIVQRGELPVVKRPREVIPLPQIGPSIGFPISQYPIRNGSQGPYSALPGGGGDTTRYDTLAPGEPTPEWKGKVGVDARWEHCIVVVDAEGNILPETDEVWKQYDAKMFRRPHSAFINPYDPQKHIWIVDDASHAVYKFSNDGKQLVQTIGTVSHSGSDATHFNRPTFLAWLPDSSMFVSDGYANTRVVKFDKDGKFVKAWGEKGEGGQGKVETRPNYFNTVHGIATDPVTRKVYVNDRANRRIQVFDENGKFLDMWTAGPHASVYVIYFSDGKLWAADAGTRKIVAWDTQGHLLYAWGSEGQFPGGTDGVHGMSVDQEGNLYMAELFVGRAMKFRPRKGANPNFLVGKPVYSAWKN